MLTSPIPVRADSTRPDVDAVRVWNEFALGAVRTTRATDADAARLYAMVNVAMYDAVHGIASAGAGPARAHAPATAGQVRWPAARRGVHAWANRS